MSEHDYPPNNGQSSDAAGERPEEAQTAEAASAGDAPEASDKSDPQADMAALNDRVLRLAAELENTRRRAAREKADAGRYAIANFARDLLDVADNFERALKAAGDDEAPLAPEALAGVISGLRMTEKELLTAFERNGVRRVFPAGEKFDPNLHQAVAHVPSASIPAGHVVDVAQSGFTIGERVLRAAMVTVSNGKGAGDPMGQDDGVSGGHVDTEA